MDASDIMVRNPVSVRPDDDIHDVVKLLVDRDISALPVTDAQGNLVGVLSEADLIRRDELGTLKTRPWWLEAITPASVLAVDYAKSNGRKVREMMSTDVVSAQEETDLSDIATLLERHRIKHVPIVRDGKLVGVVSRSNLIQALASTPSAAERDKGADRAIRLEILARLAKEKWTDFAERNVVVANKTVHLWGLVGSAQERQALRSLAQSVPGVQSVADEMIPAY